MNKTIDELKRKLTQVVSFGAISIAVCLAEHQRLLIDASLVEKTPIRLDVETRLF